MSENGVSLPRAVILTAIPVEYQAVHKHLSNIHEESHPQGTVYERGTFSSSDKSWDIIIGEIGPGNPTAALEAERVIGHYQPAVILFVGVAGGCKDVKLGDVVVSTKVYGYESGKVKRVFLPRPGIYSSTYRIEQRARAEAKKPDWLERLGGGVPIPNPTVYLGPIAAGEKVVASTRSRIAKFLRSQYSDALAVEMEGYGFLQAARANAQVEALVIRGISDLIDGKQEADAANSQEIAAHNASAFAFEILARFDEGCNRQSGTPRFLLELLANENIHHVSKLFALVLERVGESFLSALTGEVSNEVWTELKGDPPQAALKRSLGAAIERYATSQQRLDLARPLLEMDGFLTLPTVANELTQLVRFEREPNAELIGQRWKASMDNLPAWCDFTAEAKCLLEYLQIELRGTDVFRPVFVAKSLDAIAVSAATSADSLEHIEAQLAGLAQLLATRFSDLSRSFAGAAFPLREQIRDYTRFLQEKTHDFVGRQFVFDAVTRFIETQPRGYYFIRGDPGIGKSALAAQMVRTNGYVHHFNIRSEGINKTETFLKNVCAQLIVAYQLSHTFLPLVETTQDAGFLNRLLGEVSDKLAPESKAIMVIDALDEVDTLGLFPDANPLYLPVTLPQGVYIVITTRKIPLNIRIDCEFDTLDIEHDSAGNIADILEYVVLAVNRPGIQAYIVAQGIGKELFVDRLVEKSEGNFMYLHYVLPQIEHGYYKDLELEALPAGLQNYYEDHWRRMRGKDEEIWFKYKLPVVMALTVIEEPVSLDLIADFSKVQERARIREVIHEWAEFLHEERVLYEGNLQKRYHVYHASFHDFIKKKEDVEDERVSRKEAHKRIVDDLWSELFGKE